MLQDQRRIIDHDSVILDQRRRGPRAAGSLDRPDVEHRRVALLDVGHRVVVEGPAGLLAKMAERNRHEASHGRDSSRGVAIRPDAAGARPQDLWSQLLLRARRGAPMKIIASVAPAMRLSCPARPLASTDEPATTDAMIPNPARRHELPAVNRALSLDVRAPPPHRRVLTDQTAYASPDPPYCSPVPLD